MGETKPKHSFAERPENASSSSVGKDESFENGAPSQSQSGGEMAEGNELAVMHSSVVGLSSSRIVDGPAHDGCRDGDGLTAVPA